MTNIKSQIYKLQQIIYLHNYLYYVVNNPLINDNEYDVLYKKLQNLYKIYNDNKPQQIKKHINKKIYQIRYHTPMLLLKTFFDHNKCNLLFDTLIPKTDLCCELKIDGIGINLIYKNKKLIYAGTRGNGFYGENVTENIFLINKLPKYLNIKNKKLYNLIPNYCEIRGEIFLNKKDFNFLTQHLNKFNIKHFNSRNLAGGILSKKETIIPDNNQILPQQFLRFNAYTFLFDDQYVLNKILNTQWKRLNFLRLLNFEIGHLFYLSKSYKKIVLYYQKIKENVNKLDYEIDGIVLKINNIKLQNYRGTDRKYPKWAIALKFPPNQNKISYLRDIQWNMSRLGVLNPIACICPINISGSNINQLNLHNWKIIKQLDLKLNDALMIYKSGEIIPKINYVIKSLRLISYQPIKNINIPTHCHLCKCLIRIDTNNNLFCTGNSIFCYDQLKDTVLHLISKSSFNIQNLGDTFIHLLIKNKLLLSPIDIFILNENIIAKVTNFTLNNAKKIINSIKLSKIIKFKNFIYSLSIPNLGFALAKKMEIKFSDLDDLLNANINRFSKKTGLNGIQAEFIYLYIHSNEFINLIIGLIYIYKIKII